MSRAMTRMYCDGLSPQGFRGYNAHPGSALYIVVVPFAAAIGNPPRCSLHNRPYLTDGGYQVSKVIGRFRETGVLTAECKLDFGFEQAAYCHPHGWSGRAGDTDSDSRCPHWRIAAWIVRRHAA